MTLPELTAHLRSLRGVRHKLDLQPVGGRLAPPVGDDCAALPDGHGGFTLLAIEGLLDEFVAAEPWFAGYSAVMVNVSDVYAMGGRPVAVVDALWTNGADRAGPVWDGMTSAAAKYGVPIVGGHTNSRAAGDHLAAAILGRATRLLTSFDARPGDGLVSAVDLRGDWFGPHPFWNASTTAPGDRLRGDLDVLPQLAEAGLCRAAKDVSMGGVVGTATMLAECSGVGLTIDVTALPAPPGADRARWLSAFPSYGFLLAVSPENVAAVCDRFHARGLAAAAAGRFDDTRRVVLTDGTSSELFWDLAADPFIGFGPASDRAGPCPPGAGEAGASRGSDGPGRPTSAA